MSGSTILTGPIPSFTKRLTGYRAVDILVGDTLQRIAMRELGDAAQWYDLVNLNALKPPYIVDDPALLGPGLKLSGQDTLLVPSVAPPATGVALAPSVFGTDCFLQGRQLIADSSGDIATVAESSNLKQALEMALGTHPGDLVYHPQYGCQAYTLLGRGATPVVNQLAAAFVAKTINSDPRISRAQDTTATTVGDVLACSSTAVAVNGKRVPVGLGAPT
jgi:phage baseplate assembly protein W